MKKRIIISALFLVGLTNAWAADCAHTAVQSGFGVHNILSTQLPAVLFKDIKKEYKNYWITELYEEGKGKRPSYFITVENADQIIKLSSDDSENWVVVSTTIKAS
jgi:hypothetical protein